MNGDPRDIFKLTDKQRIEILSSIIVDKIIEDREKGYPLLKKINTNERKPSEKKSKNTTETGSSQA